MGKIYFTEAKTEFDKMFLAATTKGLVKISFGEESRHNFFGWLEEHFANYIYEKNDAKMSRYVKEIKRYLEGKTRELKFPVELVVKGFQKKVLMALREVPYGTVVTYGELAGMAGNPRASRAAGSACKKNPLPFVIPCHRVIAAGNRLGGYGGGERLKKQLLANEGVTGLKE